MKWWIRDEAVRPSTVYLSDWGQSPCLLCLCVSVRSQEVAEPSLELAHWADGRTTTKRLHVSYFYSELLHIGQKKKKKKKNQRSGTQRNGQLIAYNLDVLQGYHPKKCQPRMVTLCGFISNILRMTKWGWRTGSWCWQRQKQWWDTSV